MIQKRLEIRVDHSHVRATDFVFSICEVLRVSLKHWKDITPKRHYAHLPFLVTRLLRVIEPNKSMLGESILYVEKKITQEMRRGEISEA